jgi:hypothetical protein
MATKDLEQRIRESVIAYLYAHKCVPPDGVIDLIIECCMAEHDRDDLPPRAAADRPLYMAGFTSGATALVLNLVGMADDGELIFKGVGHG